MLLAWTLSTAWAQIALWTHPRQPAAWPTYNIKWWDSGSRHTVTVFVKLQVQTGILAELFVSRQSIANATAPFTNQQLPWRKYLYGGTTVYTSNEPSNTRLVSHIQPRTPSLSPKIGFLSPCRQPNLNPLVRILSNSSCSFIVDRDCPRHLRLRSNVPT